MVKMNEKQRVQKEIDMFNSLECREAYMKGFDKGFHQGYHFGWYDKEYTLLEKRPYCKTCSYASVRNGCLTCTFLDIPIDVHQVCDHWQPNPTAMRYLTKDEYRALSYSSVVN